MSRLVPGFRVTITSTVQREAPVRYRIVTPQLVLERVRWQEEIFQLLACVCLAIEVAALLATTLACDTDGGPAKAIAGATASATQARGTTHFFSARTMVPT